MSTIEDKILNGPRIHYCEAENDDLRPDEEDNESRGDSQGQKLIRGNAASLFTRPDDETEKSGRLNQVRWKTPAGSTNTGPKGVIEDHRKQNQSISNAKVDDLEAEFQQLLSDDSILEKYISKRISDSIRSNVPTFGHVYSLRTGDELLDSIDKENENVLVIVHLYTKYSKPCARVNACLEDLAKSLQQIKFVTLDASVTNLSGNFKENGVPALLAYKKGNLIKSLVQLEEYLDRDFETRQLRDLLADNGLLS